MPSQRRPGPARAWRPLAALALSLGACSNGPDFDPPAGAPSEEGAALAASDDPTVGGAPIADEARPDPLAAVGAAPIAHGQSTLPIPLSGWPLALEGTSLDAVARRTVAGQVHAIVALRSKDKVRFLELAPGPDGRATISAQREFEAASAGPIALAEQGGTVAAAWVDAGELHIAATTSDAGALTADTVLGEASAPVIGNAAIVPIEATATSDAGFLVCAAIEGHETSGKHGRAASEPGGPRCALLPHVASGKIAAEWNAIGKLNGHVVEAIAPSPHGFMVVTSTCTSHGGCARKSLSVTRLGRDGEPLKKGTRRIAEVQARRGVTLIPTRAGMLLVARRVGAGETAAWEIGEDELREAPGRYSSTLGGFLADGTTVVVETGLLVMRDGFPVAPPRPRRWTASEGLKDPELWPAELDRLFPTDVEQSIAAAPGVVVFATPARKGHIAALVLVLGRT